jgi:hypothetical protein
VQGLPLLSEEVLASRLVMSEVGNLVVTYILSVML